MNALKIAVALLALTIGHAYALGVGECRSIADMTEKLKTEGQHSFLVAVRPTRKGEGYVGEGTHKWLTLLGILVTSNDDGSLGYILQTDKPFDSNPSQSCVYARLSDIRFYDARTADTPSDVYSMSSKEAAETQCKTLIQSGEITKGTCGYLNDIIRRGISNGYRVTLQADNQRKQKDGSYGNDGIVVTIDLNLHDAKDSMSYGVGNILNTASDGATILRDTIHYTKYTQNGEKRLAQDSRRASN